MVGGVFHEFLYQGTKAGSISLNVHVTIALRSLELVNVVIFVLLWVHLKSDFKSNNLCILAITDFKMSFFYSVTLK